MGKPMPYSVARARYEGDTETLRYLGRLGAKRRKENRDREAEEKKDGTLQLRLFGARNMAIEANEDICPVD